MPKEDALVPGYLKPYMRHYHDDFWVSRTFDAKFIASLMYEGFLPIATEYGGIHYLLPKLHEARCVLEPKNLHIPKSTRKKAKGFTLRINTSFDKVVEGCHNQHGEAWLYPPVVTAFKEITSKPDGIHVSQSNVIKLFSIELFEDKTGKLVAGELGYTNGAIYTSLTGFSCVSGAGTIQLYALGSLLHLRGFQLWDLGMSMEYKMNMGAVAWDRPQFLHRVHELRLHIDVALQISSEGVNAKNLFNELVSMRQL